MILNITNDIEWFYVIMWAAIFIITLVIEIETFNLTTIWFCISALVALILSVFNVDIIIQVVVFIVLSVVLLILTKPLARKVMKKETIKTNTDRLINQIAVVTKEILPNEFGEVRIQGTFWRAVNYENLTFSIGENVIIDGISGVKLIVSKVEEESSIKIINK